MPNNINISSGSRSFQNKIFGSVTQLSKPSFVYDGKIFSDTIFNNQRTIPLLENNIYYINHGLEDSDIIYDITQHSFNSNQEIQSYVYTILNTFDSSSGPIQSRAQQSSLSSISSSTSGAASASSTSVTESIYTNNPPPPCP
jgi:hypothetical protein